MSAKSDDSRILTRLMPSLSHIASVKVAAPLYEAFDLQTLCEAWEDIQQENPTAPTKYSKHILDMKYNRAKKHLVFIPAHLRKFVWETIKALDEEFTQCQDDHLYMGTCQDDHLYMGTNKFPFCLRYDGTMDRDRMAQRMVANESIDIRKRFHLASVYNMIKSAWTLYDELMASGDKKNIETALMFYRIKKEDGLEIPCLEFPVFGEDPEEWCPRMTSFLPSLQSEDRQRLLTSLYLTKDDDFLSTLYSLTNEEEEQMLRIHCKRALRLHLEWPRQSLFLETVDKLWAFIDVECFRSLLKYIFVKNATKEDYDYGKILEGFWYKSPDHLKKGAKEDQNLRKEINLYFNVVGVKRNADESGRESSSEKNRRLVQMKMH